jgi:hypothetical protein
MKRKALRPVAWLPGCCDPVLARCATSHAGPERVTGLQANESRKAKCERDQSRRLVSDNPRSSRSCAQCEPIGALAHLGVALAYAMQGNVGKAKTAYQNLFALWKDADPDIPILKRAKAGYARLQ